MKRIDSEMFFLFSYKSLLVCFLLSVSALFFLGKDFCCFFPASGFGTEKKYQDEEKPEQSEKTSKDNDEFFPFLFEASNLITDFDTDCSVPYFIHADKKWHNIHFDIVSPPPDIRTAI